MAGPGTGFRAVAAGAAAAAALVWVVGCTGGDSLENRPGSLRGPTSALAATVDPGEPSLPAGAGYTGSEHCLGCHGGQFASYAKTAHALGLRTAGREGVSGRPVAADSDGDGRDDFREGIDLAGTPAFAGFGAAAPRLSYLKGKPGTWRVSVGGVAYDVVQVYGGSLREDYLLRVGGSLYPAPMEWDAAKGEWVALETDTWYAGTTPRFATAAAAAAGIDRLRSAERRCIVPGYDAGPGEWKGGYAELGVGCESCHGPGREHVASGGDPAKILNPRDFVDGTAAGAKRADDTCGRCHTRGTGGPAAGAPAPLLTPWNAALARPFLPGDDADAFIVATSDPADFRGYKDNYLAPASPTPGQPGDDSFVAARSGYMQGIEHARGAHAPADGAPGDVGKARCFDCHDPHGSPNPSSLRAESPRAPGAKLSDADGSLCLSCHSGRGPFAELAAEGTAQSVVNHMKDVGMPVDPALFRPAETGVGRCSTCHMPATVEERRGAASDADGNPAGGPRGGSHAGFAVWPSASERSPVTNACNACHPTTPPDPVKTVIDQWAAGDQDGDGRLHGYSPRGEHLGNLNGFRCAQCHTTAGFRGIRVEGDASGLSTDDARLSEIVRRAARFDEGITCAACHGKNGSGTFNAGANPLRLPKAQLCSSCHFAAAIDLNDYAAGTAVHFPQAELQGGSAGSEPPGSGFYESADHAFFADGCVKCHFDTGTAGATPRHDFQPQVATCQVCHPSATSIDITTFGDYDGDGAVEGIQGETSGLLAILKTAVLTGDSAVTFDGTGFRRNGVPGMPGASTARQRAGFNWETISKDGSKGVHNGPRAIKLLQQSYKELTGTDVPGAAIR
jgi:predicted CXXCH cytochrome family protein